MAQQGSQVVVVELTEFDIPGASLEGPLDRHTIPELRWWLVCRGITVPSSLKKSQLIARVKEAQESQLKIVDVDGSYLYRKYQRLLVEGKTVSPPGLPSKPLSGWEPVSEDNYAAMAKKIPCVTPGLLYTYLAEGSGNTSGKGAFRALQRGFNHWSCGRLSKLEINVKHPNFCHVRCEVTPSMKPGNYHVSMLLSRDGEMAAIEAAACECAAGNSASCTHVSALLHALVTMSESELQAFIGRTVTVTAISDDEKVMPITSYACQWKVPRKRKESTLEVSQATFEKHVYAKERKRSLKPLEDFDPRPEFLRGRANDRLPALLEKLQGKGLGISYGKCRSRNTNDCTLHTLEPDLPTKQELQKRVLELKKSLKLSPEKCREIEFKTRQQSNSSLWYSTCRFRLTASYFGAVRQRRDSTSPHSLVMQILGESTFSSAAIEWGKANEKLALQKYQETQRAKGHTDLYSCPSGFVISEEYPFIGASPDGAVHDPSVQEMFGLVEVKCPYSVRHLMPSEACQKPNFFCSLEIINDVQQMHLKKTHKYYSQVQGQMGVTKRKWCDFVVYTEKGIHVERIEFDPTYWNELVQKLEDFYDNCLAPEIVSPVHVLGLKVRDLRLM